MISTTRKTLVAVMTAVSVVSVFALYASAQGWSDRGARVYTGLGPGYAGSVQLSAGWSDNPYVQNDGRIETDSALMFRITPVVGFEFPVNEFLSFGADANLRTVFVVPTGKGEGTTAIQPIIRGLINLNATEYTALGIEDEYMFGNLGDELDGAGFENNLFRATFSQEFLIMGVVSSLRIWYENEKFEEDSNSVFFDYRDDSLGVGLTHYILPMDSGRFVELDWSFHAGEREFNDGDFTDQLPSRENPKNHDYYGGDLAVVIPVSSLLTLNGSVGWLTREYDEVSAGRDEESENINWLASARLTPGGPAKFAISASQHTADTFVFQRGETERLTFETLDGLLNNVDETFREVDVTRLGGNVSYDLSERLTLTGQVGYQKSEADASDHLAAVGGSSGTATRGLSEERITLGGMFTYDMTENFSFGGRYQYGMSDDGPEGDYDYNEVSVILRVGI